MNLDSIFDFKSFIINEKLAKKIGIEESIIIQELHSLINFNKKENINFKYDKYWTGLSAEKLKERGINLWTEEKLCNLIISLKDKGLVQILGSDTKRFFTLNYDSIDKLFAKDKESEDDLIIENKNINNEVCVVESHDEKNLLEYTYKELLNKVSPEKLTDKFLIDYFNFNLFELNEHEERFKKHISTRSNIFVILLIEYLKNKKLLDWKSVEFELFNLNGRKIFSIERLISYSKNEFNVINANTNDPINNIKATKNEFENIESNETVDIKAIDLIGEYADISNSIEISDTINIDNSKNISKYLKYFSIPENDDLKTKYNTWIKTLDMYIKDNLIILFARDSFHAAIVKKSYVNQIGELLRINNIKGDIIISYA